MKPAKQQKTKPATIKLKAAKPTIRFSAELTQLKTGPKIGPVVVALPKNVSSKIQLAGSTIVEGVLNSLPFQTKLEQNYKGEYFIQVNKSMQNAASKVLEKKVTIEIMRIGDEAETRVPADLLKALKAAPKAFAVWKGTTAFARRDWIYWMSTGKLAETRKLRIEKACDMLSSGKRRVCCFPGVTWLMKNS